jgi:hypothetical protein
MDIVISRFHCTNEILLSICFSYAFHPYAQPTLASESKAILDFLQFVRHYFDTHRQIGKNCAGTGLRGGISIVYGGPGQRSPDYSAFGSDYRALLSSVPGSKRHTAGMATCRSGCDPYIYNGSQCVCAILIRRFSVPSAFEAL